MTKPPPEKSWEDLFKPENIDPEFPKTYELTNEIKSPLNVLWYNLNFEFKDKYPAKMPQDFCRDMIKLYSLEGDVIYDPMCGSGTVPLMAWNLGRKGYGSDINPKAIELAKSHTERGGIFETADARVSSCVHSFNMRPDMILTSPPFGLNIIGDKNRYSDEPKDISHSSSYDKFFKECEKIFKNCYDNLKPKGIFIFDSRDRTKEGIYYDLGVIFRNIALSVGFRIIARYWYVMIPYRQMTFKHRETRFVMPMVSAMDSYVMYKPEMEKL